MYAHLVLMADGSLAEGCCPATHGAHTDSWWLKDQPCDACSYSRATPEEQDRLMQILLFDHLNEVVELGDLIPVEARDDGFGTRLAKEIAQEARR